jgi:hypothetical protein
VAPDTAFPAAGRFHAPAREAADRLNILYMRAGGASDLACRFAFYSAATIPANKCEIVEIVERRGYWSPLIEPVSTQEVLNNIRDIKPLEINLVMLSLVSNSPCSTFGYLPVSEFVQEGHEHAAPLVRLAIDVECEKLKAIFRVIQPELLE